MGIYDTQIATAKRLIKQKGQIVNWLSIEHGMPDNVTKPWKPSEEIFICYLVNIVFFPIGLAFTEFLHYLKNSEISSSSEQGYMGQVNFEPKLKDIIIRNNEELVISSIDRIAPNGEIILYIIGFER
ncbi:MAG: hypothetical protein ACREVA_07955 [Burkholderiales bacterium]